MPTYEYVCEKCGHEFETVQSMSAVALTECPEKICPKKKWGHGKVSKKISAGAGLLFKGSGFYITDYRSEGYKKSVKNETPSAATPAATSSSAPAAPAAATTTPAKPASPPAKK